VEDAAISLIRRHSSIADDFGAVLAAAKRGEDWALTALYRHLHPPLLNYLQGRCGPEAEDVASEVWIEVARALDRFEGDESGFRSFVFTIAWRRQVDHGRRATRRRADALEGLVLPAAGDTEADVLALLATNEAVARIVALLTPQQAEVVLLRVIADLPVDEVAAIVGKKPGAVRAIQHRALTRLAQRLDP